MLGRLEAVGSVMAAAGLGLFVLAGVLTGYLPVSHLAKLEYKTLEEVAPDPSPEFLDLAARYPESFQRAFGEPTAEFAHEEVHDVNVYEWVAWTPMLVMILVLGVYPNLIFQVMDPAVDVALQAIGQRPGG